MWVTTFNAQRGDPNLHETLLQLTSVQLGDRRPAVVALEEVDEPAHREALRHVPGYPHPIHFHGGARGHTALLIRHDVTRHAHGLRLLSRRQHVGRTVPGARHDGITATRWLLWSTVVDPNSGRLVTVPVWHPVPGASHDRAAAKLLHGEAITAAAWCHHHRHPVVLLGDCNARPGSRHMAPLRALASAAFAPSRKGAPIDGAWIFGGTGEAHALHVGTSDHWPVTVEVRWHHHHHAGR